MHVRNDTGSDLFVSAVGDVVPHGETIEVEPEVGERLKEQGWTSATQLAAKKRAAKKRAAKRPAKKSDDVNPDTVDPDDEDPDTAPAVEAVPQDIDPADPAIPQED